MKVLVAENIGASGVGLLRAAGLEVELGTAWERAGPISTGKSGT